MASFQKSAQQFNKSDNSHKGKVERESLGYLTRCVGRTKDGKETEFYRGPLNDGFTYYINITEKTDDKGYPFFTLSRVKTQGQGNK